MKDRGSDLLADLILGVVGAVWVPAEAVHGVGEDAITINTEADARAASDAPEAFALVKAKRGVSGTEVITENGERVGDVIVVATDSVQISPALMFKTNATE